MNGVREEVGSPEGLWVNLTRERARSGRCVLCGKCASECSSFRLFGNEIYSPRGRMALIEKFLDGSLKPGEKFYSSIMNCLLCGACEKNCPSRVRPRLAVLLVRNAPLFEPRFQRHRQCLTMEMKDGYPALLFKKMGLKVPAEKIPTAQMRGEPCNIPSDSHHVFYFPGCMDDIFFKDSCRAAELLVRKLGYEFCLPSGVVCCGALHLFTGMLEEAQRIAMNNISALNTSRNAPILCDCATCAATLRLYPELFPAGSEEEVLARKFAERVFVLTDWLDKAQLNSGMFRSLNGLSVAYDEPCTLRYDMCATSAPRRILSFLQGINLVKLPQDDCSAGLPLLFDAGEESAAAMIQRNKADFLKNNPVDILVTEDFFSRMWWQTNLAGEGRGKIQVMALSELLAQYLT